MVLSNKKLKQKVRELMKAKHETNNPEKSPITMKQLLSAETHKPILSKREKKRENPPLVPLDDGIKDTHVENKREKKKRKKIKGSEENGELEIVPIGWESGEKKAKLIAKDVVEGEKGDGEVSNGKKVESLSVKERKKKKMLMKKKNLKKKQKKIEKKEQKEQQQKVEVQISEVSEQIEQDFSKGNDGDGKKVYVGGIPYYSTEEDIRSYFYQCGVITDIDCMTFPETGKFRGIAILEFQTEEGAKSALDLDGSEMGGLFLKIQPYKTTRTTKSSDFSPPVIEGYNRIYAGNLSWDITEDDMRKFFSDCNISSIRLGEDKETGDFKGYAHVDFGDNESLNKAFKLDQSLLCGRRVKISRAVPKKGGVRNGTSSSPAVKSEKDNQVNTVVAAAPMDTYVSTVLAAAPVDTYVSTVLAAAPVDTYVKTVVSAAPMNTYVSAVVAATPVNAGGVSSGKLKRRTCYDCGERGHISSDCPKKKPSAGENPSES